MLNVQGLIDLMKQKRVKFIFFFREYPVRKRLTEVCLSQWYKVPFEKDGVKYISTEQWMMSEKAKLFKDMETYDKIMAATENAEFKKLGREVKNFDSAVWDENKVRIVYEGNMLKFSQNEDLCDYLLSTRDAILVEASPYDKNWGIRMGAAENGITDPKNWRGENLLGFILMDVREDLR